MAASTRARIESLVDGLTADLEATIRSEVDARFRKLVASGAHPSIASAADEEPSSVREIPVAATVPQAASPEPALGEDDLLGLMRQAYLLGKAGPDEHEVAPLLAKLVEKRKKRVLERVAALFAALTPREREMVEHLVAGRPTQTIAASMGITVSTANTYFKRIFQKLGVHSRVELVAAVHGKRSA